MIAVVGFVLVACGKRDEGSGKRDTAGAAPSSAAGSARRDSSAQRPPSEAAASGQVQYFSAETLARAADALAGGSSTGRTLRSGAGFQYVESRRTTSGEPEVHDFWADVALVQAGRGTILTGGRVSGGTITAPGEHRGGTIVGGTVRSIGSGDLLVIPAGVPHQYGVARGDSLRYITVKVARSAGR